MFALLLVVGLTAGCGGSGSRSAPRTGLRIYDPAGLVKAQVTSPDVVRSSVLAETEPGGTAVVFLALWPRGNERFLRLTRALAHRGLRVHRIEPFAFEVNGHVYARPGVDYRDFPDGYSADAGTDIHGVPGDAAKDIVAQLREGAVR